MKHLFKKVTALTLVIALIMSLLPAVTFASESVADKLTIKFDSSVFTSVGDSSTAPTPSANANFTVVGDKIKKGALVTGSSWDFVQVKAFQSSPNVKANWLEIPQSGYYGVFTVRSTDTLCAGTYKVSFTGGIGRDLCMVGVYVDNQFAGIYDEYSASASGYTVGSEKTLGYVTVDSDKQVEIMFCNASGTNGYKMHLSKISLERVETAPEIIGLECEIPDSVEVGKSFTIAPKVAYNNGEYKAVYDWTTERKKDTQNNIIATSENSETLSTNVLWDGAKSAAMTATNGQYKAEFIGETAGESVITVSAIVGGKTLTPITKTVRVTPAPKLQTVEVKFEKDTIPATRSTKTSLTLIRDNGDPYKEDYTVVYSTSSDTVATIDENGVVTAHNPGTATITATVTAKDGTIVPGTGTITVTEKPVLTSISVAAKGAVLPIGAETEIVINGKMSDGIDAVMTDYTYTFEAEKPEIADVSDEGIITAISEGQASVIVKTVNEKGKELAETIVITVDENPPPTIIDFKQTITKADYTVPDITPGYRILRDISTSIELFAKYTFDEVGEDFLFVPMGGPGGDSYWPSYKGNGVTFAFEVDVPFESDYQVTLSGGRYSNGAYTAIYSGEKYLGDYNFYIPESICTVGPVVNLNTVHLKAGPNVFYLRLRNDNYYQGRAILNTLTLTPIDGNVKLSRIDLGDMQENIILAVGESISGTSIVRMNDDSAYHFAEYTNDGNPETENTVSASSTGGIELDFKGHILGKTGKNDFTISATEAGLATFSITANVEGETVTKTVNIDVRKDDIKSASAKTEAEEVFLGDSTYLIPVTTLESGRILSTTSSATTVFKSKTPDVAVVDETTGLLASKSVGTAEIEVTTTFLGKSKTGTVYVEILPEGMTDIKISAGGSKYIRYTGDEADTVPLYVQAISNVGRELDTSDAEIAAEALTPEYAKLDSALNIIPVFADPDNGSEAVFRVTVKLDGRIRTVEAPLTIVVGKSKSSYFTEDIVNAVRENVKKYDWAKAIADKAMGDADFYVENVDALYDAIPSEGLPRSLAAGIMADPYKYYCRFCGTDLRAKHGAYSWNHNIVSRPWKIQCPDCKRLFPSNDFEGFYKLGLNEYKEFDYQRALDAHHRLVYHGAADAECSCDAPEAPASDLEKTPEWYDFYGYGNDKGYLYNKLYKDVDPEEIAFFREGESLKTWGVDDGFGYIPRKADGKAYTLVGAKNVITPERHTYISEYIMQGFWNHGQNSDTSGAMIRRGLNSLKNTYYYTGDIKYGRALAILLDRVSDFYGEYDMTQHDYEAFRTSDTCQGKALNHHIWENGIASLLAESYDLVFDLYESDPYILNYIKDKGKTIKFRHAKNTPSQIRTNIEDGALRGGLEGLTGENAYRKGYSLLGGNFGYPQVPNATMAIVLDTMPETAKWLDYLMAPGFNGTINSTGGGVDEYLVNQISRDGQGNENSAYNVGWLTSLIKISDILDDYDRYPVANFYNNPKFVRMMYSFIPLMSSYYTPQIGDTSVVLGKAHWITHDIAVRGWAQIGDPIFAQVLYAINGNSSEGLRYGIDANNPDCLADEVQEVIDTYGPLNLESDISTGFGFGILRDGAEYRGNGQTAQNTYRDTWMYFGSSLGHGHRDTLNLGMTAFGLNFMPDLGYPEEASMQPNRLQWVSQAISHNTVVVNEKSGGNNNTISRPKHFDDGGMVKLMDVDAPEVYENIADIYRRSVITVKVDDENSYTVDFFRILGGNDHLYSFHASSDEIAETAGLNLDPQVDENGEYKGTYAGKDATYIEKTDKEGNKTVRLPVQGETLAENEVELPVEKGPDPYSPQAWYYDTLFPRGYTWVDKVDRDNSPGEKFEIDFKIKDFNKVIKNSSGLRLRMTMLDGGNRDGKRNVSVSTVNGYVPNKVENKNIPFFRYVFVQHSAKDENSELDTMFTTVFEPYRTTRYIKSIDELLMTPISGTGTDSDAYKAVKVEHTSGRVDYILYATNNNVTYEIELGDGRKLTFSGFVGVYTVQNGENTYKYLHDGTVLGTATGEFAAIEGTVVSFTEDPSAFSNEIVLTTSRDVMESEVLELEGKMIIIENDASAINAAYKIEAASLDGRNLTLDIGNATLINSYKDAKNPDAGYNSNIAIGQAARIPLSYSEDNAPEFDPVSGNLTTSAGSSITVSLNAESPLENVNVTYNAEILPRGASLDAESGTATWKPDSSQVGDSHFAITATDDFGRESTVHFTITVYGSTTGSTSSNNKTEENTGTSSGGAGATGGGGGGGAAPSDEKDNAEDSSTDVGTGVPDCPPDEVGDTAPDASGETNIIRFTDLFNHAWAADAINSLASAGIIKGTSASTFSPGANITRADFALLLVRAFNLTSDNLENFADVSANDYFASELAIARNTGIVAGIGDNKFAPRNPITRQDMMVIVYRALNSLEKIEKRNDTQVVPYDDFASVADYAQEAVTALIGAGLVNGKNGLIAPLDYTTRAEIAVLLERVLDYIK